MKGSDCEVLEDHPVLDHGLGTRRGGEEEEMFFTKLLPQ